MYKFTGFTDSANDALNFAVESAENMGHTYIGSEHILYGLISEGECVAAKLLESKGATPARIKDVIINYSGVGTTTSLSASDMTPRTKSIIQASLAEAQRCGQELIGTEHLLLSILRLEKNIRMESYLFLLLVLVLQMLSLKL